jgi:hypothetical protein
VYSNALDDNFRLAVSSQERYTFFLNSMKPAAFRPQNHNSHEISATIENIQMNS